MDKNQIKAVESIIGYEFDNKALLVQAYTLRSYAEEHGGECNEVLEWIGDSFVYRFVTEMAFENYLEVCCEGLVSEHSEGWLSKWRQKFIGTKYLASRVDELGLAKKSYFAMGKGDTSADIYSRLHIKENLLEALIGAIAVDCERDEKIIYNCLQVLLGFDNDEENLSGNHIDNPNIGGAGSYIAKVQEFFAKHEHFVFSSWSDCHPQSFMDSGLVGSSNKRTQELYEFVELKEGWRCNALIPEYKYTTQNEIGFGSCYTQEPICMHGYNGKTNFVGHGHNKKEAKEDVAKQIWEYVSQRQVEWLNSIAKNDVNCLIHVSTPEDRELTAIIVSRIEQLERIPTDSAVNALDELCRKKLITKPEYTITDIIDNDDIQWQAHVSIKVVHNGKVYRATTKHNQKKEAKKKAAYDLLKKLGSI
ncbi:MAG: hypothetical protein LBK70_00850 [Clostridiales bacterium]|jgi:dsRNA-specific ribonuclease|nr:hypothetical protein [Clostridiales bacterium]